MSTIPSQLLYQMVINHIAPAMLSSFSSLYTSYFSSREKTIVHTMQEIDDERELELLQMDRLLKWMNLIFKEENGEKEEMSISSTLGKESQYKQELFSIYRTIVSDYKEYQRWKAYNKNLWMFSSYRSRDTKYLAKKILADVRLFQEGLKMFSMFERLDN